MSAFYLVAPLALLWLATPCVGKERLSSVDPPVHRVLTGGTAAPSEHIRWWWFLLRTDGPGGYLGRHFLAAAARWVLQPDGAAVPPDPDGRPVATDAPHLFVQVNDGGQPQTYGGSAAGRRRSIDV